MMEYHELVSIDNFRTFMKRSYEYMETRWEPEYKKEVTYIGKSVMLNGQ